MESYAASQRQTSVANMGEEYTKGHLPVISHRLTVTVTEAMAIHVAVQEPMCHTCVLICCMCACAHIK